MQHVDDDEILIDIDINQLSAVMHEIIIEKSCNFDLYNNQLNELIKAV